MSDKFRPLKTISVTCNECGHTGHIEVNEKDANTAMVNFVAKIRHDERSKLESQIKEAMEENEKLMHRLQSNIKMQKKLNELLVELQKGENIE